ncbi:uncharacterized protein [Palaemon carinicauda]|uniref:uncharacterized protein isoform X5 n=1 Tax=Palaemon carinicauda TaxID=392227 RepID=UPI0035B5ADC6
MSSNLLRVFTALLLCFSLSSGQEKGCFFEGIWHSIGDYFTVYVSNSVLNGNAINYLCTGTGMVAVGCGLLNMIGVKRDYNGGLPEPVSIPFGTVWVISCEEYECLKVSGWTPTGNTGPGCISSTFETTEGNGISTTFETTEGNGISTTIETKEGNGISTNFETTEGNGISTNFETTEGNGISTNFETTEGNGISTNFETTEGNDSTTIDVSPAL